MRVEAEVGTASATAAAAPARVDRRGIATLSAGHACVDLAQGAVPALLPFLVAQRGYGYAEATALLLAMTVGSSLLQPLFGVVADRRPLPWLLPAGPLLAGGGIAVAGVVDGYAATLAAVAVSGIGVGAYHPEAARFANYVSGARRASGMSLFSVGGNAGFALGPLLVTPSVLLLGLDGTALLAIPAAALVLLLVRELPRLETFRPRRAAIDDAVPVDRSRDRWGPFSLVAAVAAWRSGVYFGLQAFVPAWFIVHLGTGEATGNAGLATLLVAGAVGTLLGGPLADRVGRRPVLVGCMVAIAPLVLLLQVAGLALSFVLLALLGMVIVGNFSITVVLGQEMLPSRVGLASGITLGAAIGTGGLVAFLLGFLADAVGVGPVLLVVAAFGVPAVLCALALPRGDAAGR